MQSIATPSANTPSFALREHSARLTVEHIPITLIDQGSGTPTFTSLSPIGAPRFSTRWSAVRARMHPPATAAPPTAATTGFGSP